MEGRHYFRDILYGCVGIAGETSALMDTKAICRLRGIRQLGCAHIAFPALGHRRYEHALGVAHLGGLVGRHLAHKHPSSGITAHHVTLLEMAGMGRDAGLGPCSRVWDDEFLSRLGPEKETAGTDDAHGGHKRRSLKMIERAMQQISATRDDVECVKHLIAPDLHPRPRGLPSVLSDIISNPLMDVDRIDCTLRDRHHAKEAGLLPSKDEGAEDAITPAAICAMLERTSVAREGGGRMVWAFDPDDEKLLADLVRLRARMHQRVHHHPLIDAANLMAGEAFRMADPTLDLRGASGDPAGFECLNDLVLMEIAWSTDPALEQARALTTRLLRGWRHWYRHLGDIYDNDAILRHREEGPIALRQLRLWPGDLSPRSILARLPFRSGDGVRRGPSDVRLLMGMPDCRHVVHRYYLLR